MQVWVLIICYSENGEPPEIARISVHRTRSRCVLELDQWVHEVWEDFYPDDDIENYPPEDAIQRLFEESPHYSYTICSRPTAPDEEEPEESEPKHILLTEEEVRCASIALQLADYEEASKETGIPVNKLENLLVEVAKRLE